MAIRKLSFKAPNLADSAAALRWVRHFLLMQGRLRSNEPTQIVACAAFGALVGMLVAGLHWLVDWLHHVAFNVNGEHSLSAGIGIDPARILVVPMLGGLILGIGALVVRRWRANDVVDPIEANALHGGRMSMKDSLRMVVATVWSNGSGVSVGMEAGYSQLGAAVLAKVGQYFRLRREEQRIFVAAGAGAAIAAAFNTPLAGAFYGYELILGGYSVRALAPVAAAALSATVALRVLTRPDVLFRVEDFVPFPQWFYWMFVLLGILAAGLAILAMRSVTWSERLLKRLPLPQWLRPAVGGALVTVIALLVPQVLGGGHGAIQLLFDRSPGLLVLSILLVTKLVASGVSLGAGFRGGMFSTSLLLGALFGGFLAQVTALLAPAMGGHQTALMMVGMASVAAATIGAPLTMVFLVLEGTGNFPLTVGVMVGVVIASTIVRMAFGYSFSTWRFHQRGIGIRSPHDIGWLADLTVGRLMRTDAKVVLDTTPLRELREKFPPGSAKHVFVASENGSFMGTLDMAAIHDQAQDELLDSRYAREFAAGGDFVLEPYENVRTALSRFEDQELEIMPVVDSPADKAIIGYLTEQYALRRYNQELERRRNADLGERDLFSIAEPPR